jgi:pimeloyl-ACP methyl ester carboxylesterase
MGRVLLGFVIILSMIGVTAITVRYQRELGMTRKTLDSLGSQVVETNCGPLEYARVGEGVPVLVIHGNGGGFDQGLGLAQSYLGQGFQVIAPSRFGYLRTPVPAKATPELQADAYACLLDHLGIQRAAVFTTSAGVTSAVQFALRHPERVTALVLHSPNAPGKVDMVLPPKFLFTTLMKSDFAWWALSTYLNTSLQSMVGVPKDFALTPQYQADVKATLASVLPISQRANGMMFDTYISNPEINRYPLGEVSTPTLVISAVDDPMALHANARGLADQIPGARLLAVPDGGHLLLGHTEEVKAEIVQFLDQTVAEMTNNH